MNDLNNEDLSITQDEWMEWLKHVVDLLGTTLGPHCEVVLHDLRQPATSVIHVANGHVTNRAVKQGIRDLLGVIHSPNFHNEMLLNYASPVPLTERQIRSSTVIFRNRHKEPVGALCLNLDVTEFVHMRTVLDELVAIGQPHPMAISQAGEGTPDVAALVGQIVANTVESYGKQVDDMDKGDKLQIISFLHQRGAFLTKGSVELVAEALHVSRHSIYKYLQELKKTESSSSTLKPPAS